MGLKLTEDFSAQIVLTRMLTAIVEEASNPKVILVKNIEQELNYNQTNNDRLQEKKVLQQVTQIKVLGLGIVTLFLLISISPVCSNPLIDNVQTIQMRQS